MLIKVIDVSSAQPREVPAVGADMVIVKLYLPIETIPQSYSIAQAASAQRQGMRVGGYVWCYKDASPYDTVQQAYNLARRMGIKPDGLESIIWLDLEEYLREPPPNPQWLRNARAYATINGIRIGIYTNRNVWRTYFNNTTEFNELPLWLAQYDGEAVLDVEPLGGWTKPIGKQYIGVGLDTSIFEDEDNMARTDDQQKVITNLHNRSEYLQKLSTELTDLHHLDYADALHNLAADCAEDATICEREWPSP